eukprot:365333-Chlamydomonas_euryale.AAC.9
MQSCNPNSFAKQYSDTATGSQCKHTSGYSRLLKDRATPISASNAKNEAAAEQAVSKLKRT